MYHNFVNSFSKLSENTFYKEISIFQLKVQSTKVLLAILQGIP